jgi:elongation factor Ts
MKISAQDVKKLREETGISIMMCKKALIETNGNLKEAKRHLRKQGEKIAAKKLVRETHQGIIASYIHNNLKIGAMIEVHCETDFVAKSKEFQQLCKELVIQIAGYSPLYISPDYITKADLEKQEILYRDEFSGRKLAGKKLEKAVQSKLEKFKKENSLLSQPYFKDEKKTVEDLIKITIARLGENIQIKRFTRYQI